MWLCMGVRGDSDVLPYITHSNKEGIRMNKTILNELTYNHWIQELCLQEGITTLIELPDSNKT